jgi:hypothetical protein
VLDAQFRLTKSFNLSRRAYSRNVNTFYFQ